MRHLVLSVIACVALASSCATVHQSPTTQSNPSEETSVQTTAPKAKAGRRGLSICNYDNQADCEGSYLRCIWSPVPNHNGKQCFSKDVCSSDRPAEICNRELGCVYNNDRENPYCLSATTSRCNSATVKEACEGMWQCAWNKEADSSGQHCVSTTSLCNYHNQADCEGSTFECMWSPAPNHNGKQCFTKAHCSSDRPQEICNKDFGCVFNNDKDNPHCMSPKLSSCKSATAKKACGEMPQCIWSHDGKADSSGVMQHCFGTANIPLFGYSCADYPRDICATNGCIYDEMSHKCLSRRVSGCDEFHDSVNCENSGCLWENTHATCLTTNPVTTKCADFTTYGKSTCEKAGCLFDEKANPPVCASKYKACAEYLPLLDSCPVSFGCRISADHKKCESNNCNFNVHKDDCLAQPGCKWNLFCRNLD